MDKRKAGCAALVGNAVALCGGAVILVFAGAQEIASNYLPDQARSIGLGFLAEPPPAISPIRDTPWYRCDLDWSRSAINRDVVAWTVDCRAKVPLTLTEGRVAVYSPSEERLARDLTGERGPALDEGDPLAGQQVRLRAGESWRQEGTLRAAPAGRTTVDHLRTVAVQLHFEYPDEPPDAPEGRYKHEMELASTESAF